ncbi:MAG: hypothetical protein DMF84_25750 [Acidobacteria bacterium]|nr:MAG: hypothetical protein DMF84_25750 [Acidobacteriota bacterium]
MEFSRAPHNNRTTLVASGFSRKIHSLPSDFRLKAEATRKDAEQIDERAASPCDVRTAAAYRLQIGVGF